MRRLIKAQVSLALFLTTRLASADDGANLEALLGESMQSTASRTTETSTVAPATSVVVTAEELHLYGVTTLAEALTLLSPGFVSLNEEVGVRGTLLRLDSGSHILWLLNGHRLNEPYGGSAVAAMPLELVDRIEFVLGPGSVLYGSNAMQGVVNVVTKDAERFSGVRAGVDAISLAGVRPWVGGGHTFELFGQRAQIVGGAQYRTIDRDENQPRVNLGIDPFTSKPYRFTRAREGDGYWGGAMQRFTREPSGVLRIVVGDLSVGFHAALASENPPIDPGDFNAPTSKLVDRVARVDVEYQKRISTVMTTTARLYADAYDQRLLLESSRAPVCMVADGTCRLDLRTEAQWGGSELQARFDWLRNGTFVTMVGGEAAVRHARTILDIRDLATGAVTTPSTGIIDRGVPQLSTYGQQTWSPLRWLDLNAGVRVDYDPRFEGVVSPREAIRVTPWSGGTFKLIHSQAYRAPTFRESFMNNALQPLAEDLRPETVRSFEGVFQQAFGGQRLRLSVFQSTWKNLIDLAQLSSQESAAFVASGKSTVPPLYQYRNLKEVDTRGFELSWEGSLLRSRLQHAMNVTSTLSDTEDNHPLDGSPRLFGNARVSYALGGGLPTLGLATTFYTRTAAAGTFDAPYTTPYYAPAQLVTRVVVAGQVPHISRLTYRGYVSYAAADRLPLTVGPAIAAPPLRSAPLLSPVDRFTTLIGLAYEF